MIDRRRKNKNMEREREREREGVGFQFQPPPTTLHTTTPNYQTKSVFSQLIADALISL
jgi:hypothetical protein